MGLEQNQVVGIIGLVVFLVSFKYSHSIFYWIEENTIGTRDYIMEKLDLLHINMKPDRITQMLLFLSFGLGTITLGLMTLLGSWKLGVFLALVLSVLGWKIPRPAINYLIEKRIKEFQNQMVDALTLLSNGVRAGLSLPQSFGMVVNEMPAPISQEFNKVLSQNKLGAPLEECLENLAERMHTEDNKMFVSAINILRETGGNLAETFDTIIDIIRERIRLQQKVDTYIAQGMVQGITIFCMPFAMGAIFFISDPKSMEPLFNTPVGILMLILALGLDIAGAIVIMKIVKIKV